MDKCSRKILEVTPGTTSMRPPSRHHTNSSRLGAPYCCHQTTLIASTRRLLACATGLLALTLSGTIAIGQTSHPLEPPDRSSPRATLKTFLESMDATCSFVGETYINTDAPHEDARRIYQLARPAIRCLDLSGLPPATRDRAGRSAAAALYEVLSRIELPPDDLIPDASGGHVLGGTNAARWVIPHTEIALEQVESGQQRGQFLFSPETVANAVDDLDSVRALPYTRAVPFEDLYDQMTLGGGWMILPKHIEKLPPWMRKVVWEQPMWKWVGVLTLFAFTGLLLRWTYRLSRLGGSGRPLLRALVRVILPAFCLLVTPGLSYVMLSQLNLLGNAASVIALAATAVLFLSSAWIAWRLAPVVAELAIASPRIASKSVDAHLMRIFAQLFGIVAAILILAVGADRVGLPLYGMVAGLGVGGLAIALAAQSTLENLIGGLNLFADRPVRVGDFCKYGLDLGTIEDIGLRSTRIRGLDRTVAVIPNAMLSKIPIINYTQRDRTLINSVIGLRYETTPDQLRFVLAKMRELLLAHPKVTAEPSRVRFIGFGASSLNLEIFAYVSTNSWDEFLAIQEDINLRIMEVVSASGTSIAFPSQTLYLNRDTGRDADKSHTADLAVQAWRQTGQLPFPDFDLEFRRTHRDTLDYPPSGSAKSKQPNDDKPNDGAST